MPSGNTSKQKKNTTRVPKKTANKPTMSRVRKSEKDDLLETCGQIGLLIFGSSMDPSRLKKVNPAVGFLRSQAAGLLLKQYLDEWLPMFDKHFKKLEKIFGRGVPLDDDNLVNDIKTRVKEAGFESMREFLTKVLLPMVTYQGLLLFMVNDAKVRMATEIKDSIVPRMDKINKILKGACFALTMEDMGL
ncbi:MAG: hypothetical protein ACYTDT_08760 [Planctomycetota bacterium]|jgi:hypothetical protein